MGSVTRYSRPCLGLTTTEPLLRAQRFVYHEPSSVVTSGAMHAHYAKANVRTQDDCLDEHRRR